MYVTPATVYVPPAWTLPVAGAGSDDWQVVRSPVNEYVNGLLVCPSPVPNFAVPLSWQPPPPGAALAPGASSATAEITAAVSAPLRA